MGVLIQPLQEYRQHRDSQLPVYFPETEQLFFEFLQRYQQWSKVKRQENLLFICLVITGVTVLFLPWLFPQLGITFSFLFLSIFCIMIGFYQKVNGSVHHHGINTRILHHHLIGKLEVGFCQHHQPCSCAEDFRQYVLKKYFISLYDEPLNGNINKKYKKGS